MAASNDEMRGVRMQPATIDVDKRYTDLNNAMVAIRGQLQEALETLAGFDLEFMFTNSATHANSHILPGNLNEVDWNVVLR